MNLVLVAMLFSQLSYFEFDTIRSPQIAGDSFIIKITAYDANGQLYDYNGPATLSSSRDGQYNYAFPYQVDFVRGVCLRRALVTLATDSLRLICSSVLVRGTSNSFAVLTGAPCRLVTTVPGESLAPGSLSGRGGTALPHRAGESFVITTYLTDRCFNPTSNRSDSIRYTATDEFASLPQGARLQNSRAVFPVSFRQLNSFHRIFTFAKGNSTIAADTSSEFQIEAGGYQRLVMILPGESLLTGDTTTRWYASPGKKGRMLPIYVRDSFPVTVIATDSCYNPVPTGGASIVELRSQFVFGSSPREVALVDSVQFKVEFDSSGDNQLLYARDRITGIESYPTRINVRQKTKKIEIYFDPPHSDTVRAGAVVRLAGLMLDANDAPIPARPCRFSVTSGHGRVLDSVNISDTAGVTYVRFVCDSAHFAEFDTVQFAADDAIAKIGIYIDLPDSAVMPPTEEIIAYPNPFGYEQLFTTIVYYVKRSSNVTVAIYDPFGNPVFQRKIPAGEEGAKQGINKITWNGRTDAGVKVADGVYVLKIWGTEHTGILFRKTYRIGVVW